MQFLTQTLELPWIILVKIYFCYERARKWWWCHFVSQIVNNQLFIRRVESKPWRKSDFWITIFVHEYEDITPLEEQTRKCINQLPIFSIKRAVSLKLLCMVFIYIYVVYCLVMQRGTIILYIILNRCKRLWKQRVCPMLNGQHSSKGIYSLLSNLAKRLSSGWQQNQVVIDTAWFEASKAKFVYFQL